MESISKIDEKYAVVFNVNLLRATLNEASEFKDYLEEMIGDTDKDIVVNLSNCEHLDSTFLGVLVNGYKRLKNKNRNLVIIEPVDQSSIFLTLNSIGKIFPLYADVKSALEDIENKKLLESELGELDKKPKKEYKTKNDNSFKISAPPEIKQDEATLIDELSSPEELAPENQENEIEEDPVTTILEENTPVAEELVLIESDDDTDNILALNSVEITNEVDISLQPKSESNQYKNTATPETETVSEEVKFSKGTVKWEFGFN